MKGKANLVFDGDFCNDAVISDRPDQFDDHVSPDVV